MTSLLRSIAAVSLLAMSACQMSELGAAASTELFGAYRVGNKGPFANRTDGIGFDVDNYGPGIVSNGELEIMFNSSQYVSFFEDFLGDFTIPDEGSADGAQGPWACSDTNQAAAECTAKADYDNGAVELVLDNDSEVGDATLFWDDEQNIDTDTEPFCVFRFQTQVALAAADAVYVGLASAQNDLVNSLTTHAGFSIAGADTNLDTQSDDNSADVNATDTGVDLAAATFIEVLVSMNSMHGRTANDPDGASPTDVHFFYRTTTGAAWTQVNASTTFSIGADKAVQPYVQIEKTSGTTTPDILVDYIRCAWQRE